MDEFIRNFTRGWKHTNANKRAKVKKKMYRRVKKIQVSQFRSDGGQAKNKKQIYQAKGKTNLR